MSTPDESRVFFAACTLGLESVLADELRELGGVGVEEARGGVHVRGDPRLGYAACLWLRSAVRLQELVVEGRVERKEDLYALVAGVDWSAYLDVEQTLAVHASIRDSFATDPRYPALLTKDAIVDQFRERLGRRPSVDRREPDLPLRLVLRGQQARLYRDWCGASLHKRGYRPIQVKSPLNEAIAAGLLLLADWDRSAPLVDPMCGSATLAIEAAWIAGDRAPGLHRRFPFERWPDFDRRTYRGLRRDAEDRAEAGRASIPPIEAADHHPGALSLARQALMAAGVASAVRLHRSDVAEWRPSVDPVTVVTNPPYGERIGRGAELQQSWHGLGTFLHERCGPGLGFVLSGNSELSQHLRMKASRRWPVHNGPIECRWLRYELRGRRESRS